MSMYCVNEFVGRWRISAMEMWDQDYIDLLEPGFFEFGSDGLGSFVFGAVRGWLDARVSERGARVDFTWQGECEGDDVFGRGWFTLESENQAGGMLFIHAGDESGVTIVREA